MSQPESLPDFSKLWNFNDPAATEKKFHELVEPAHRSGDTSYYLQLLTQLARTQGLQDKFTEAHATLDEVRTQLRDDLKVARIRYLLERGRVFNSSNVPDKARPLFVEAWELASSNNETKYAADALHMLAIVEPLPAGKIKWNLTALAYIKEHPQEQRWLNAVYNNLGEAYLLANDYEKALESFQNLIELSKKAGQEPWIYTKKDVAKCLRLLNRTDEAIALLQPVFDELKKKNEPDAWICSELGESIFAKGQKAEARALFKQGYELFQKDEFLMKHEPEYISKIKKLSEE